MGTFSKKVVSASLAVVTTVSMFGGSFSAVANAATTAELQAQIAALTAQLSGMSTTACTAPSGPLTVGSNSEQVRALQTWLNANGYTIAASGVGSRGMESTYFGMMTKAALARFQAAAGITPAVGYYGPMTMAAVQARCAVATTPSTNNGSTTSTGTTLSGNAGSITVDDLSTYSSEEVGEDEEDVPVMAFEIEADDDSDIEVTSIKVELVQGTAADSEDITDYIDSVSVWFNGKMVGSDDADDFTENSDVYTKAISLKNVIIKAGDTEELVIAVTALSSLDSGDINSDAFTVDVLNVRFKDGDGVTTTEDTDSDALEQSFDFASAAEAADLELKLTLGDEEVNDAHIINVDSGDDTDNVALFSFELEAEGDTDVMIKDLTVLATTTEAAGTDFDEPGDIVNTLYLYADGTKIATESLSGASSGTADSQRVTFDDIDFTIDAGETVEFVVKGRIIETDGVLDDGDTIRLSITDAERDMIDAEDETGEDVATTDMSGTAAGDAHAVYDVGFDLDLVSVSAEKTFESETSGTGDRGTFVIKYKVTAIDGDIYIDNTCFEDAVGAATSTSFTVSNGSSNTASCTTTSTGETDSSTAFLIEDGESETITLTVQVTATADASAYVQLESIGWDDASGGDDNIYDFNLPDDFKTDPVFLDLF